MNESPWISIIIPVYNAGQYFEECLQTVCGNTQLDIEIILIDDGSTDGSGNTARKWAAKDVRVRYIQQENQGCSSARNHGIELARGKWIMFVDADDTIEPDTMKKLRVLEPKFEDAEIVCFGCHMNLPENMTELHKLESAITEELALSACGVRRPENGLPETNFASMCWKLYRGDFLRRTNLKIDRELVRGEDLLFNCHAFSEAYSIAFSPYDYYNYRNNPQSATRRRNPAIKERDAVFQKKLQAFANQYRYRHLEQIVASVRSRAENKENVRHGIEIMNERKKGAILSYIQVFLSVVVSMIYVPVLLYFLGQSEYGLYQIVGSFFSYVTVFESCVSAGILRNYCNALGRSDHEEASVTLSMARSIYRFLALLLDFVGIAVIFAFRSFYAASFTTSELNESIAILILLFVNMTFTLQGSVYLTVLTGHEKYTFLRILSILMQVIQPLLVILCVSRIPYAITVSVVIVLLNLLTIGIRYGYVTQKLKIRITKQPKDSRIVKSILGLSAAILLGSIADQIFWKTDQVILGRMFNTAVVAVYSVGAQIYMMYMQFGTQVSGVFYPKISALYQEENGLQKVSDLFIRIGRITFYIILLILSGFIIFGREFLLLWVGEGYEEAYWVAIIVMLPFSIDLAQNLGLCILQIKGQYGFRAKIYFLSAVLNIVTTVLFTKLIGIVGAALSTGVSMFLTSGLIMNWYFQRKAGLDIKKFWKETAPVIITAVLLTMSALILKQQLKIEPAGSIWKFGAGVLLYTALYAAVMLGIVANQSEKKQFLQIVTSLNLTLKRK